MSATGFHLDEQLAVLERTPTVLGSLLRGAAPGWHEVNEGPGTWSVREVVAHLVHAEEGNWVPRAALILERGDRRPFDPFDRFAHLERYGATHLDALLDRFAALRERSLATVRGWELSGDLLSRPGLHPGLGSVTLRQLLATWVVHDLGHIAQVVRVMAQRNAAEVGPWREYLSILGRPPSR